MRFLQHIECFFIGGKPTFILESAIGATVPVYYRQVPEAEDFSGKFKPLHTLKGYDVPELPLEFVDCVPKDEDDKKKTLIIKTITALSKFLGRLPFKDRSIAKGDDEIIFDQYIADSFAEIGIPKPSFDSSIFEPEHCVRNGIFYSFLRATSKDSFVIDFTNYTKYSFKNTDRPPILKAHLKLDGGKLVFESISRFDKNLNVVEVVSACESDEFIKLRSELYANAFFELTTTQHLIGCHFLAGSNLNVGVRMLSKSNPLKQWLWNFVFGTLSINAQVNSLIGRGVGTAIGLSPFTDSGFYEFVRDVAVLDNSEIFEPQSAIDCEVVNDLKSIKRIITKNVNSVLDLSNLSHREENERMFSFLRHKVKYLSEKTDTDLIANLVYAVSAHHEVAGNNSLEYRSQSFYTTYGSTKYDQIIISLVLLITAIPIRKITAHDVEHTVKNKAARRVYLNMVQELLAYEESMVHGDARHLRIKPSNLEAAVQV